MTEYRDLRQTYALTAVGAYQTRISNFCQSSAKAAVSPRAKYNIGELPLHPGSIGPIYRAIIQGAFDAGVLPDLTKDDLDRLLKGVSAHSTQVGLNRDLFTSGEDLAGIMDALRRKSSRMPHAYNRNLSAEHGTVGRLMAKIG